MCANKFLFFLLLAVFFSCVSVYAAYELSDTQPVIPETKESTSGGYTLEVSDQTPVFVLSTSPADGADIIISPVGDIPVAPPLNEEEGKEKEKTPSEDITVPAEPETPVPSTKEKVPKEEKKEEEQKEEEKKEEEETEEKVTPEEASQEQMLKEQEKTSALKSEISPAVGKIEDITKKQETVTTIILLEGKLFVYQIGKIAAGKIIIRNQIYREGVIFAIGEDTIIKSHMEFLSILNTFKEHTDKQTTKRIKIEKERIQKLKGIEKVAATIKATSVSVKNLPISIILFIGLCIIAILGYVIYLITKKK